MATLMAEAHSNGHAPAAGFAQGGSQQQQQPSQQPEFLTKEDIGAAMAGMTFALQSTEERITTQLQKTVTSHQMLYQQVYALTLQISQQSQLLQNQSVLLQRQQELLAEHAKTIQLLQEGQQRRDGADHPAGTTESTPSNLPKPMNDRDDTDTIRTTTTDKKEDVPADSLWRLYASIEL
uniref:Uncharacterized protein n=1 Tax=Amphora coffeiformis TaxID=265554 RepID=A0A7S3P9J8_9STRA